MGSTSSADPFPGARRRTGLLPLAVAAVVVPTVLAGLTLLWPGPRIEDDLTRAADASLAAAGIAGAQVVLDGRDAVVDGPPGAVEVVRGVTGLRVARAAEGGGTGPGAGDPQTAATAALAGLAGTGLAGTGLAATVDGTTVTLTGTVGDDAASAAVETALAAALPGLTVDNRLTVAAAGPGTGAATQQLAAALEELVAAAPITFEPDSPALTAAGSATVARVVELVAAAPGARLQVDGYVAAGPGDGRLTAQQLSDQRAATVGDALVAGGVPADRVVVRGLGEGPRPVPDVAGRRVEITVV